MDGADSLVDSGHSTDTSNIDSLRNLFSSPGIETVDPTSSTPVRPIKRTRAERRQLAEALKGSTEASVEQCSNEPAAREQQEPNAPDSITVESTILSASDLTSAIEQGFSTNQTKIELTPEAVSRAQESMQQETAAQTKPEETVQGSELTQTPDGTDETKVSRNDLVNALESFVNLIKNTGDVPPPNPAPTNLLETTAPSQQKFTVQVDDKTAEVEELRCLLVEAQQTIIRLLTERVEDRAKVSQLETQLRLLPDLQAQADRAIAVAMNTEDFRRDLTKVKFELERVRLAKVRNEVEKSHRSWFRGMRGWFFKTRDVIPADELDQATDSPSESTK